MTVNKLMASSHQQLGFIQELKVMSKFRKEFERSCTKVFPILQAEQEELGSLAAETLGSITKGQEKLLEQQEYLKATQHLASQQISSTMRELSRYLFFSILQNTFYRLKLLSGIRERAAAFASQRQLAALSDSLKETLDQAAQLAIEQENERKVAQQHLLDSLTKIEGHVGDFWSQLGKRHSLC